MATGGFLTFNGRILSMADTPSLSFLLENHSGAYTTTRTHNGASTILFLDRHLRRLIQSAKILCNSNPELFFRSDSLNVYTSNWEPVVRGITSDSLVEILPFALDEMKSGEELAITVLLAGRWMKFGGDTVADVAMASKFTDLYVHVARYVPIAFGSPKNSARLALVGRGRDVAAAKYSDWVRCRKPLEKLRPPLITELLLSNDGDHILEGCVSNFFVVCRTGNQVEMDNSLEQSHYFEVQTAPIKDGVLPGIIRQLIIEECLNKGIPFREVAPSWSMNEEWEEAFITNSLRLVQHIEEIQAPNSWMFSESTTWKQLSWKHKKFKGGAGPITTMMQKSVIERAMVEGLPLSQLHSWNSNNAL